MKDLLDLTPTSKHNRHSTDSSHSSSSQWSLECHCSCDQHGPTVNITPVATSQDHPVTTPSTPLLSGTVSPATQSPDHEADAFHDTVGQQHHEVARENVKPTIEAGPRYLEELLTERNEAIQVLLEDVADRNDEIALLRQELSAARRECASLRGEIVDLYEILAAVLSDQAEKTLHH